jgi:lysophospholipase L1-like esterase
MDRRDNLYLFISCGSKGLYLSKKHSALKHQRIIWLLANIIIVLVGLEILLQLFDPLGMARYGIDGLTLADRNELDPRGYALPVGIHQLSNWQATINVDRTRLVPNTTENGEKTIVFVGDSATFGFGVNDEETWVNLLARKFPTIKLINAGVSGFNSTQVLRSLDIYPADAYIWLTIPNDLEEAGLAVGNITRTPSYLALYLRMWTVQSSQKRVEGEGEAQRQLRLHGTVRYERELDTLSDTVPLTLVAFDDEFGQFVHEKYDAYLIPWYTNKISAADGHPNSAGHQQIASHLEPIVEQVIEQING